MTIRVLLIDDEPFSRDELRHLLSIYEDIEIIGEAGSAEDAFIKILDLEPDALFLDIDMGGKNGVELAASIQKLKNVPHVIFATAHPDYAVSAFRVQALDYILKPFEEDKVEEAVARLRSNAAAEKPEASPARTGKLAVQQNDSIFYLAPQEIDYIYRDGPVTKVESRGNTYLTKLTLKEMEGKLSSHSFFRPHKGYLVNLGRVEEMTPWFNGAYQLSLANVNEKIPVSRNYVKPLRAKLEL
ncbi:LytR/AlgR family response regulator transcription factor [Alkalicoccus daliensis]|uniref:Two component transcriptional regulator, LytTR family n=1 Tax=Alkalicoccus daliensis TaxID=745820 RepID=A0A1H0FYV4_9BACI|nr:LytTR family DNA-binding domain-containing protein [Alkalicoccus daliensis]SDN99826.1 two component transcriptional regulator, LytTR family [Alkalicoccus daliensis]